MYGATGPFRGWFIYAVSTFLRERLRFSSNAVRSGRTTRVSIVSSNSAGAAFAISRICEASRSNRAAFSRSTGRQSVTNSDHAMCRRS
jgi:hypothetical protein